MTDAMSLYGIFCIVIVAVILLIVALAWIVQGVAKLRGFWGENHPASSTKRPHNPGNTP